VGGVRDFWGIEMKKAVRVGILVIGLVFGGIMGPIEACMGQTAVELFKNPVIYADVPDPDVVRVGSDFYMVSTTMHLMPGAPIMHSRDLVHWEIVSYVFEEIGDSPLYDLEGGNVYGKGQWAASLRYQEGVFYVFFSTNLPRKAYLYSTVDPRGRWERVGEWDDIYHDASLLFEADGRVYLSHIVEGAVHFAELREGAEGWTMEALAIAPISGRERGYAGLFEGSHFYHIGEYYYLFIIWWPRGGIRTQLCFRAERVEGPYEGRVVLSDTLGLWGRGVAQGGVVDTEDGRWYGFFFQDHGAVGRTPVLTECRWEAGWPVMSVPTPREMAVPVGGWMAKGLVASDGFEGERLDLRWQWNHNPDAGLWSLGEREGYLRLRTGRVVESVFEARNTLSQRMEGPGGRGSVCLDISGMKSGDVAGLGAFCAEPGLVSVVQEGGERYVVMTDRGEEKGRVLLGNGGETERRGLDTSTEGLRRTAVRLYGDTTGATTSCRDALPCVSAASAYHKNQSNHRNHGSDNVEGVYFPKGGKEIYDIASTQRHSIRRAEMRRVKTRRYSQETPTALPWRDDSMLGRTPAAFPVNNAGFQPGVGVSGVAASGIATSGIAPCAVRHNMLVESEIGLSQTPDHPSASVPYGTAQRRTTCTVPNGTGMGGRAWSSTNMLCLTAQEGKAGSLPSIRRRLEPTPSGRGVETDGRDLHFPKGEKETEEKGRTSPSADLIWLRVDCDFTADRARFFYSLDGERWLPIGAEFRMIYNLAHFMGNRFAIYYYATQEVGGHIDIDFFHYNKI
jgi:arabinoxylan arabinofuranohydrolase